MTSSSTSLRVGLVVLLSAASFVVVAGLVGHRRFADDQTYPVTAVFDDASGLGPKSRIQIAGLEVGEVERIELTPDARARAVLRLRRDVVLHDDARITKRAASLLGDHLLDLFPGSVDRPPLPPGGEVRRVTRQPGIEEVFEALSEVTRDIGEVTRGLKGVLVDEGQGGVRDMVRHMNAVVEGLDRTLASSGGRLDRILGNVEAVSSDIRSLSDGQGRNVTDIVENVRRFTEQANRVVATLDHVVGSGEGDLKESVASVRATLAELQRTLTGAQEMILAAKGAVSDVRGVVARVDRGEGTIGRLVRDDGIAVKLDRTLGDVSQLIAPVAQMQTQVHLREELHWTPGLLGGGQPGVKGKTVAQLRIAPRPDKYYGLEMVSDPRGRVTRQSVVTTRNPPGANEVAEQVTQTSVATSDYRLSAFLAKRFGPATFKVGVLESSGGGGVDLQGFGDRLRLSVDAFDWANPAATNPRLRASANARFTDHLYVGVGIDDALNDQAFAQGRFVAGRTFFGTGGLFFTDDDLKSIMAVVGMPPALP
jgi:phospholipid/cholesterol/gamma-HCH transport system substrate-binding protein